MSAPPPLPSARRVATRRQPGLPGIVRGVWLMTWRGQMTLKRLPFQLGMLLILPFLVYLTMMSQENWANRRTSLGRPMQEVNTFARQLRRQNIPFQPATLDSLAAILNEEYSKSESSWHDIKDDGKEESAEDRRKRIETHLNEWDKQIRSRAKTVLDERQYAEFKSVQDKSRDGAFGRMTAVSVPWHREEPFYHWLVDFYFYLILPLMCIKGCGSLIRDELQADTLGFLLTRPVGRARLILVKYIAQVAWLEMVLLLELVLLFAVGSLRQVPTLGALFPLMLGVQIFVIPAWSALGLLLGQFTSRYMASALLYGAVVEMGIGNIPTNINTLSLTRHVQTLFSHNAALQKVFAWPESATSTAIIALVVAPVIFLSVAALLFKLREYHHAAEMQK